MHVLHTVVFGEIYVQFSIFCDAQKFTYQHTLNNQAKPSTAKHKKQMCNKTTTRHLHTVVTEDTYSIATKQ